MHRGVRGGSRDFTGDTKKGKGRDKSGVPLPFGSGGWRSVRSGGKKHQWGLAMNHEKAGNQSKSLGFKWEGGDS